jgi:predicted MFS family arabinose efflux permease
MPEAKMPNARKLSGFAVLVQATLWAILLIIFLAVLPGRGFHALNDFNNPARLALAPFAMSFIAWSDLLFGLTMMINVLVLERCMRTGTPPIVRRIFTIALIAVVGWFIAHDLGIHVLGWSAIARDPASTNYAMDRLLWGFRNGVFFMVGILTFIETAPRKNRAQAGVN